MFERTWYDSLLTLKVFKMRKWDIAVRGAYMLLCHILAIPVFYSILSGNVPISHFILFFFLYFGASVGMAVGAHRLWAHRSFKANLPLRILLMLLQTESGQDSILKWVRDHRLHHKFGETDGDPHNIKRGFFFSHMGWYLISEHPEVTKKEENINLDDVLNDAVVRFQHKYYFYLLFSLFLILPSFLNHCLGLSIFLSVTINLFRHAVFIQLFSTGNSVAHSWTMKPYDKSIGSADVPWLSLLIAGEGWHNFHHVFPWDYRSTDVGLPSLNLASFVIDQFARIGWAYDLKTVSEEVIKKRAARTGDGSYGIPPGPWGWGDEDIPKGDIQDTVILKSKKF